MNPSLVALGVGFVLVGAIAAGSGRRQPSSSVDGKKASSPRGTLGMFFIGLGAVLVLISL